MPRNIDIFLIYTYRSVSSDMAHNSIFGAQTAHTKANRYGNKCPCAWTKVISKKLCPRGHKKHSAHSASASLYSLFKNHTANFTMSRTERLTEPHRRSQKKNRRLLVLSLRDGGFRAGISRYTGATQSLQRFFIFSYGVEITTRLKCCFLHTPVYQNSLAYMSKYFCLVSFIQPFAKGLPPFHIQQR